MNLFEKIFTEYSRKHEDEVGKQIFEADPKKSSTIAILIDNTLKQGHDVWIMTDCHFIRYNKDTGEISDNPNKNKVIDVAKKTIKHDDLLIYLGDLIDGEVEKKEELSHIINSIPGMKVLVRGNNDLFPDEWYLKHGFAFVTPKFIWDDILFAHRPQDNQNKLNIHGHVHCQEGKITFKYYNTEISHYHNQIDAAYCGARVRPIKLQDVIDKQPEFGKHAVFLDEPWKGKSAP